MVSDGIVKGCEYLWKVLQFQFWFAYSEHAPEYVH